jgi:glutathione S-transferase
MESKRGKPDVPRVGYWKIRGLVAPICYLFEYLGVEYERVQYEQADDLSREAWYSVKHTLDLDFPNIPYLIHGDFKITESQAIFRYVCNTWQPELLGKTTKDKAVADMLFGVVSDVKGPVTSICYSTGDRAEATKTAVDRMGKVADFMESRDFVVGDYVTFTDFFLFEQEELFNWISEGKLFKLYPSLEAHHKRMTTLPRFGEFLKSDRFMARPFNNKSAKLNN